VWLVPVGAAYLAWYVAFGRPAITYLRDPFTLEAIADVPRFVWTGIVAAMGASTGTPLGLTPFPVILALGLLVLPILWLARVPVSARALGGLAGLVAMYTIIGLVRAQISPSQPTVSRYLYEGVVLVVLVVSGLLGDRLAAGRVSRDAPWSVALAAGLAVLLVSGLVHNASTLLAGRREWTARANEARAYIALLDAVPAALIRSPVEVPWTIPDPPAMRRLIARHGSPARDALLPSVVPRPKAADRDRALFRYVGGHFRALPAAGGSPAEAPRVIGLAGGRLTPRADGCLVLVPERRTETLIVQLPDGQALDVTPTGAGDLRAYLGREEPPQRATETEIPLPAGRVTRLGLPVLGDGEPWLVRLVVPDDAGETTVCPVEP
jgi:hypothetical protein